MINLDTHIVLFTLTGELRLREKALLAREPAGISAIVLWEITKLFQRGRIDVSLEDPDLTRALSRMTIWPIDRDVCLQLNGLDFHSDPADELIAATSLAHGVPLLTRDRRIRTSRKVLMA